MVDSMQNGVGIVFSIKYACTSEKIYTCSVKRKKVVPDHVFSTKKMAAIVLLNVMLLCVVYGRKVILHCKCNKYYIYINMIYTSFLGLFNEHVLYLRK